LAETNNSQTEKSYIRYFILAYAISWLLWLPGVLISFGIIEASLELWIGIGNVGIFGPTIAAFILIYKDNGSDGVKELFWSGVDVKRPKPVWYLAAVLPLLLLAIIIWGIFALAGVPLPAPGSQATEEVTFLSVVATGLFLFIFMFIFALGEEFGWRGYAIEPMQERWNAVKTSLLLGTVWAFWHYPIFFITGVGQNADLIRLGPIYIINFTLITIGLAFLYTWLFNNSKNSVFLVLVFHGATNGLSGLFNLWTTALSMTVSVIAIWIWVVIVILYYGPEKLVKE